MSAATELKARPSGASDMAHIVLTFDNNRLASALYGQFDENLARIEQKLGHPRAAVPVRAGFHFHLWQSPESSAGDTSQILSGSPLVDSGIALDLSEVHDVSDSRRCVQGANGGSDLASDRF